MYFKAKHKGRCGLGSPGDTLIVNWLLYVRAPSAFSEDKWPPSPSTHVLLLCMRFLPKITETFSEELESP